MLQLYNPKRRDFTYFLYNVIMNWGKKCPSSANYTFLEVHLCREIFVQWSWPGSSRYIIFGKAGTTLTERRTRSTNWKLGRASGSRNYRRFTRNKNGSTIFERGTTFLVTLSYRPFDRVSSSVVLGSERTSRIAVSSAFFLTPRAYVSYFP